MELRLSEDGRSEVGWERNLNDPIAEHGWRHHNTGYESPCSLRQIPLVGLCRWCGEDIETWYCALVLGALQTY